jgi:hypothetical protein
MLNSTTWLYGAEVLPIALRSKVMGLAAASHFIVNVASKKDTPLKKEQPLTKIKNSHRGRTQCFCQHKAELLLCLRGMLFLLPRHCVLLFPVSDSNA